MSVLIVAFVSLGIGLLLALLLSVASRRDRWRLWQETVVDIRRWIEAAETALDEREIDPIRLAMLREELERSKSELRQLQQRVNAGDIDSDESVALVRSSYEAAKAVLEAAEAYPRIGSGDPPLPPKGGGSS